MLPIVIGGDTFDEVLGKQTKPLHLDKCARRLKNG